MKCGDKEWQHCRVEKMGCTGCYYDEIESEEYIRTESGHIFKVGKEKIRVDFPMSKQLYDDVELLKELSFNLRHKKIKIVEEE